MHSLPTLDLTPVPLHRHESSHLAHDHLLDNNINSTLQPSLYVTIMPCYWFPTFLKHTHRSPSFHCCAFILHPTFFLTVWGNDRLLDNICERASCQIQNTKGEACESGGWGDLCCTGGFLHQDLHPLCWRASGRLPRHRNKALAPQPRLQIIGLLWICDRVH